MLGILFKLTVVTCVTAAAWTAAQVARQGRVAEVTQLEMTAARDLVMLDLDLRLSASERMAQRLASRGGGDATAFGIEARALLADMPGFFAVAFLDADYVVRDVRPAALSAAIGRNVADFGADRAVLAAAAESARETRLGDPLEQQDGAGVGFVSATPVFVDGGFVGHVWVVFNAERWIDNLYFGGAVLGLREMSLRLWLNDAPLYEAADFDEIAAPAATLSQAVAGATLRIEGKPRPALVARTASLMVEAATIFAAAFTVAMLLVVDALRDARRSKQEMDDANRMLEGTNRRLEVANAQETALRREVELQNARLEHDVAARTETIRRQAQELEAALDAQVELNRVQRTFVSMASHEFRTPLAIIDAAASALERRIRRGRLEDDYVATKAAAMRRGVARMVALMESTLAAARSLDGKFEVDPRPTAPGPLIAEVCRDHEKTAATHAVRFAGDRLPDTMLVDPRAMVQIVSNLVSNAVKYSPDADVVDVAGRVEGGMVVLEVRDYGVGVPEAELTQLFDRFFRASTSAGIAGTGIGLSLVKLLIDAHGGDVDVSSTVGEGTVFTVRLPIAGPGDGSGERSVAAAAA